MSMFTIVALLLLHLFTDFFFLNQLLPVILTTALCISNEQFFLDSPATLGLQQPLLYTQRCSIIMQCVSVNCFLTSQSY